MEKIDVNGDDRHPIYAELTETADAEGNAGDITWNFEKFLVSPQGDDRRRASGPRWSPRTRPSSATSRRSCPLEPPQPARRGSPRPSSTWTGCSSTPRSSGTRPRSRSSGGLGVPLAVDGCRTTKGMFVGEVTAHWYGLLPVAGPDAGRGGGDDRRPGDRPRSWPRASSSRAPSTPSTCARDRGLPLAVASSSQYRLIDAALEHFDLRDHFALVHSAEDEDVRQAAPGRVPRRRRPSWASTAGAAWSGRTRRPACWRPRRPPWPASPCPSTARVPPGLRAGRPRRRFLGGRCGSMDEVARRHSPGARRDRPVLQS